VVVALTDVAGIRLGARIVSGRGATGPEVGAPTPASGLSRDDVIDLYRRYYVNLCRTAELLVDDRGRAEELVQDAFTRTFAGRQAVREVSVAPGYLRRAVIHACHSELRRRRVERRLGLGVAAASLEVVYERPASGADFAEAFGDSEMLTRALRSLTSRQREAIVLRYYADLDEDAIAAAMGCSNGTVKSQLAKAREKLARLLGPETLGEAAAAGGADEPA
jgi:RNA polymerase sigma factor (sigma-70 family)